MITFDFGQYPTLLHLMEAPHLVKFVTGPAGSAKTSAIAAACLMEAMTQKPHTDGVRYTKTLIARATYQQLIKSTVPSWRTILADLAPISDGKPPTGHVRFPMEDGTVVDWQIIFFAFDNDTAEADIPGLEFTNCVLEELATIDREDLVILLLSRLGRYPSALFGGATHPVGYGVTNGPRKSHWLYRWAMGDRDKDFAVIAKQTGRPYFNLWRQPPALLKNRDGTYSPNPRAENVQNLPGNYGYYFAMLGMSEPQIQSFVMGEFADLQVGKPVYPTFNPAIHVIKRSAFDMTWPKRGPLGLTFDFGRTPVMLVALETSGGGLIIIDEIMDENTAIESLWHEKCRPTLVAQYPNCHVDWATGDPAGDDMTQAMDVSPYQVLQAAGVPIEFPTGQRKDAIQPRVDAVRLRLQRLDLHGRPALQITDNCTFLIEALTATYIYEEVKGKPGTYQEVPTKSHLNWVSDLGNALEYVCQYRAGALEDLARASAGAAQKQVGRPLLGG